MNYIQFTDDDGNIRGTLATQETTERIEKLYWAFEEEQEERGTNGDNRNIDAFADWLKKKHGIEADRMTCDEIYI